MRAQAGGVISIKPNAAFTISMVNGSPSKPKRRLRRFKAAFEVADCAVKARRAVPGCGLSKYESLRDYISAIGSAFCVSRRAVFTNRSARISANGSNPSGVRSR